MWVKLNDLEIKKYRYNLCTSDGHLPPRDFVFDKKKDKMVANGIENETCKWVCEKCGMATVFNPVTFYSEQVI